MSFALHGKNTEVAACTTWQNSAQFLSFFWIIWKKKKSNIFSFSKNAKLMVLSTFKLIIDHK